jgi:hypothetical protein
VLNRRDRSAAIGGSASYGRTESATILRRRRRGNEMRFRPARWADRTGGAFVRRNGHHPSGRSSERFGADVRGGSGTRRRRKLHTVGFEVSDAARQRRARDDGWIRIVERIRVSERLRQWRRAGARKALVRGSGADCSDAFPSAHTSIAAWRRKPSWYAVSTHDRTIDPNLERFMAARMKATTIEVAAGHLSLVSHPREIATLILAAARRHA